MYDIRVIQTLQDEIGFRDHWNTGTGGIPALPANILKSNSGQVYQSFNSLVRLDYIQAMLGSDRPINEYLDEVVQDSIVQLLNKVSTKNGIKRTGEELSSNKLIYTDVVRDSVITNQGRFVGVRINLKDNIGIRAVFNRIGLYLTVPQTAGGNELTLYLFNSLQETAIDTFEYSSTNANSFEWLTTQINIDFDEDNANNSGGIYYLGYYQDDLLGQAVKFDKLNWRNGWCGGCLGQSFNNRWLAISKYVDIIPFFVAAGNLPAVGTRFEDDVVQEDLTNNFGFNFNVSIVCNVTQFYIDNVSTFRDALGKSVALRILQDLTVSSQSSAVEQNIQVLALRAVEADVRTKANTFVKKVDEAIDSMRFNNGNVDNNPCVPCARKGARVRNG